MIPDPGIPTSFPKTAMALTQPGKKLIGMLSTIILKV